MNKLFSFDEQYLKTIDYLIGTDEAGRGPGAGPVFAAAVCFVNPHRQLINELDKLNDSKQLTSNQRENFYEIITKNCIWSVMSGSVEEIEALNILKVSLLTMKKCVENVASRIDSKNILTLVDGNKNIPQLSYKQESIIKGDTKSAAIAAASIIAKVTRDRFMIELDKDYPEYGWGKNKGYMTKQHIEAVEKYGLTKWHRKKFFQSYFENHLPA